MCGITGSVGKPNNSILAYNLHTNLLRETKRRGRHATGFYAVGFDRKPIFDKAPVSAEVYITRPEWKQLAQGSIAMIGHARFTTNGAAHVNGNNHPHVSKSGNMALVHNGIIYNYNELKDQYSKVLESECDSEIILRIIAKEKNPLKGIKKVYELLGSGGDFACELIHINKKTGKTMFYFFRDSGRPGVMIDARKTLGQLIFCSEENIWKDAVYKSGMSREVRQLPVHEIPEYKILAIDADSLEVEETEVEKPKMKSRPYISRYTGSNYNQYNSNYNDYDFYKNHSRVRNTNDTYNYGKYYLENDKYNAYGPSVKKSELQNGWTETINPKTGLPKFVFDNDAEEFEQEEKIFNDVNSLVPEEDQDPEFKMLLQKCIDSKEDRYPGWQDEAYSYGLITEEQWAQLSDEEIEHSEDFLDHINSQEDIEDLDEYLNKYNSQQHDDEFLDRLSQQIMIEDAI